MHISHWELGSGSGSSRLGSLEGKALRGLAVAAVSGGTDTDLAGVDGAGNAVAGLDVQLGKGILLVDGGLSQITEGGSINHVADDDTLNSLVL